MAASQKTDMDMEKLVEALIKNDSLELNLDLIAKLKKLCKLSNENVTRAYYLLMMELRKDHAEIRYIALLAINELFIRSFEFRKLLESDFEEFLQLTVETDPDEPLPPPKAVATRLKLKTQHFIKQWHLKFGDKCKVMKYAYSYLQTCKKINFDSTEAQTNSQRVSDQREAQRRERNTSEKVLKMQNEMEDMSVEINSVLHQIENCFQLILPLPEDIFALSDFMQPSTSGVTLKSSAPATSGVNGHSDQQLIGNNTDINYTGKVLDEENIELRGVSEESLRHHGLYDMKSSLTIELKKDSKVLIEENEDTLPILENLNDLYSQICTKYLPAISRWLKVFTKGNNSLECIKKAIDWKQMLEAKVSKFKELNIQSKVQHSELLKEDDDDEEENDSDFEEVKEKEGFEPVIPKHKHKEYGIRPTSSNCTTPVKNSAPTKNHIWSLQQPEDSVHDPTSRASTLNNLLNKLVTNKCDINSWHVTAETAAEKSLNKDSFNDSNKMELLKKAPVLPYDIDLYHWEEEKLEAPYVVKFDSLHSFWQSKNDDEVNEAQLQESIASLRTRTIDFSGKFEPVKWNCRAPLKNGNLCPRRDRYKCPFHGKIIKRDEKGNPADTVNSIIRMDQPSTSKAVPDWQDPEFLGDIEAATGINLRLPQKRKAKNQSIEKKCGRQKKKTKSGRTNIKSATDTTYRRLHKKVFKNYKRYSKEQDLLDQKKFDDKFGHQWNYSMQH